MMRAWRPAVRQDLAKRDRFLRRPVAQQRRQAYAEIGRLETLVGGRDLIGAPPLMAARPASLALVEPGGIGLRAVGMGEEKAFLVKNVAAAPAHAALARPYPARRIDHRQFRLFVGLAHGGFREILAVVDHAADHHPERVVE